MKMEFSVEYCFRCIMEFKEKYGDYLTVKKFEERIINLKIPKLSYLFMKNISGVNKKAHTNIILSSNDPKLIYETAKIKGVNTKLLENAILSFNSPYYSYIYARDITDANVSSHESVVVNNKDESYGDLYKYHFATDVKDADVKRLGESVLNSGPSLNFFFARDVKDGLLFEHINVVKSDKELYDKLINIIKVKTSEELEKQRLGMCKEARRVLRKFDYIEK